MSGSGTLGVIGEYNVNEPIGGYNLPSELATELYEFCRKVDREVGTNNGECALFWHVIAIFDSHTKPRTNLSIEEDF